MTAYNELQQIFVQWNATDRPYPSEKCIHHLIAEQAARTPDAVAVSSGHHQLSYRELDHQANQLASYLRRLGVCPETLVGVMMARSAQMVVGLLGILKAGGGYVPLDAQYPVARLRMMVEDAGVRVVLT
ncbi:MAG: AMP-binding protein, partial [Pyrinomonadaceae bacterium]